jgi:hypothetical protein
LDAVQCAVEIQKKLKTRNSEMPENQRMEFRIGIHLGQVIAEGKDIYGERWLARRNDAGRPMSRRADYLLCRLRLRTVPGLESGLKFGKIF